jgi:hypothetical protein
MQILIFQPVAAISVESIPVRFDPAAIVFGMGIVGIPDAIIAYNVSTRFAEKAKVI